jgi:hypothetical protein
MSKSSKEIIHVETDYDKFDLKGYRCELSAYSFIPTTRKDQNKQRNYFNHHCQVAFLFYFIKNQSFVFI